MSADAPSTHGPDGGNPPQPPAAPRGPRGRFATGNKLGRGNPLAGRAARIRAELLRALTPADAKAIAGTLIDLAKGGDLAAINTLLDRTIGKPSQLELLERVEALETSVRERNATNGRNGQP